MLGAVNFGGLGENGGAAVADEQISGSAQGGVGGNAGIPIGAATLQGEHQFRSGNCLASGHVYSRQHFADASNAGLYSFASAAALLNGHSLEGIALADAVKLLHSPDLEHFATKADEKNTGQIRI